MLSRAGFDTTTTIGSSSREKAGHERNGHGSSARAGDTNHDLVKPQVYEEDDMPTILASADFRLHLDPEEGQMEDGGNRTAVESTWQLELNKTDQPVRSIREV